MDFSYPCTEEIEHKHKYHELLFHETLSRNFDETIEKVIEALKEKGFGVLTEIDIKSTLKKKEKT